MPLRPTTPATTASATGRPPAPTRAWTSLWSPFHLPRPANTSRRSCATMKHTKPSTSLPILRAGRVQGRPDRTRPFMQSGGTRLDTTRLHTQLRLRLTSTAVPATLISTGGVQSLRVPFAACCCSKTGPAGTIGDCPVTSTHRRAGCQPTCSSLKNGFPKKWTPERFSYWKTMRIWVMRRTRMWRSCPAPAAGLWD